MKAFRLAIVRQKYRPDGGAERFVSRALEALEQQDLDLNVITREWQGDANPNWHIHLCNPLKLGRISRERGFAVAARALWQKERFDLVQSHERIPGCDIYRAGDGVHRRWLLQRARLLPEWRRKWLFSNRYHRYVMCAERAMYAAPELKAVICNAEMIKQEIIADFGVPAEKITVIYNAIDNQKFPPADEALRQRLREQYQIPQQAHCLIFVGSGFERKGLAAAIRAVAVTDSHLLVVGKDKAEKRYRALAQSLGCGDRVHFMGVQKQTLPFYQAADALLLPTLYDPFPNVILEAMSCGLPVITSTTCGGAEFITPGQNGFVTDALDVPAIAEAIRALPRQALGSSMGEAARLRIMPATPAHLSEQLISLYNRLLD
ncbi:glycosyltransferase family 4 protein [Serratia marcescens]|jgi:Glycosyltransferase|uniref:glycosyltransferase family 4 protein n=1 Tax=Serratia marcescens TaxID=615 RepID=UPI00217B1E1C|nr:glycosyltransferase family 4 protein [Serratia marcescens]MDP8706844.1 glycosyltransferase family 4 protein [Serratia marcescens]MDP8841455.1 glycosyltransferase family 4 protein [Serratia marcescens]BEL92087.1 glycosyl transferase family 1 [Serratia marcescens]CAI2002467.1 Lipopolysaccharide core biosynthesis protein rfaG [Serratia marcescens]